MTAFLFWFRGFLFDFPRFALIALSRARREKQSRSYQPTSIYHPLILVISYSLTLSSLITSSIPPAAGDKGPEQAATRTAKVKPTRFQSTPNHPLKRPNRGTSRPGCAPLHPPCFCSSISPKRSVSTSYLISASSAVVRASA